jgi:hypothetical protein
MLGPLLLSVVPTTAYELPEHSVHPGAPDSGLRLPDEHHSHANGSESPRPAAGMNQMPAGTLRR